MAPKKRSSISTYSGLSVEHSAKLRRVVVALEDPELPCGVPDAARQMLAVGVPEAVRFVIERRHKAQSAVCTHVQECMGEIQAQLTGKVEHEKLAASQDESEMQSLQSQLALADAAVTEVAAAVELRKSELKETQGPVDTTTKTWLEASSARVAPGMQKRTLERTAASHLKFDEGSFKLVFDGTCENAKELKKAADSVSKAFLAMPDIEEALIVAAPGAMAKSASERGNFDNMVMTSLKGKLTERSQALAVEMADVDAKIAVVDVELAKLVQEVEEAKKTHDIAEVACGEAESLHIAKLESRKHLQTTIDARKEASLNRDNVVLETGFRLELLAGVVTDFESLVARSEVVPVADEPMPAAEESVPATQELAPTVVATPQ